MYYYTRSSGTIIEMRTSRGFTVVELVLVTVLFILAGAIFWSQKQAVESENRDEQRKVAINAIAYALEEVYYPQHNAYPRLINAEAFTVIDDGLLKDPAGNAIGSAESDYRYQPLDCDGDACSSYVLRGLLEREADYVKESQR